MPGDDILSSAPPPADERVPYGSEAHQFGDLRFPKGNGPHPVVMNIHGGFWRNEYDPRSTAWPQIEQTVLRLFA
jgi:acetyl esterase/lipase